MALSTGTARFAGAEEMFGDNGQHTLSRTHLLRAIDEVDYGMLVIDARGTILHADHLARHELASGRMLVSYGNSLLGSSAEFTSQIQLAMESSFRGQRKLLMLVSGEKELSLAFTPLSHPLEADAPSVLVLLSALAGWWITRSITQPIRSAVASAGDALATWMLACARRSDWFSSAARRLTSRWACALA